MSGVTAWISTFFRANDDAHRALLDEAATVEVPAAPASPSDDDTPPTPSPRGAYKTLVSRQRES